MPATVNCCAKQKNTCTCCAQPVYAHAQSTSRCQERSAEAKGGVAGIEPATSRTQSENHTPRPNSRWCGSTSTSTATQPSATQRAAFSGTRTRAPRHQPGPAQLAQQRPDHRLHAPATAAEWPSRQRPTCGISATQAMRAVRTGAPTCRQAQKTPVGKTIAGHVPSWAGGWSGPFSRWRWNACARTPPALAYSPASTSCRVADAGSSTCWSLVKACYPDNAAVTCI